jgi:hypothetical protein
MFVGVSASLYTPLILIFDPFCCQAYNPGITCTKIFANVMHQGAVVMPGFGG